MPKLNHIPDKRMLDIIDRLKKDGVIQFKQDFYDTIGIHKQSVAKIKVGLQHFTALQIASACKNYNINANWIMGIERQVFRDTSLTKSQTKE